MINGNPSGVGLFCYPSNEIKVTGLKGIERNGDLVQQLWRPVFLPVVLILLAAVCPGLTLAEESADPEPAFELKPDEAHGHRVSGMMLSEYEDVNVANGNLTLSIPLASIATDGGLSYSVNAYYNSKLTGIETFVVSPGDTLPPQGGRAYLRGVENFGLGWDVRPPRLAATIECDNGSLDPVYGYPVCDNGGGNTDKKFTVHAYVSPSGTRNQLISVPPNEWDFVNDADDYDPAYDDGNPTPIGSEEYCNQSTYSAGGDLTSGNRDCPCTVQTGKKQVCYTWTEPLLRVTLDMTNESDITVIVEDDSGTVSRFNRIVDNRARLKCTGYQSTQEPCVYNFRQELDGFYITSLERGPWENGVARNIISFDYFESDPWLVESIWTNTTPQREVTFDYVPRPVSGVPAAVLSKVSAPAFGGGIAEIDFTYRENNVVASNTTRTRTGAGVGNEDPPIERQAPFLESITAQAGDSDSLQWTFSNGLRDSQPDDTEIRLHEFDLPTGATFNYSYRGTPSDLACVVDLESIELDETTTSIGRDFLYTRTLTSQDASMDGTPDNSRVETTALVRNINCMDNFPGDLPYPNSGSFQSLVNPASSEAGAYYWVWVETYGGSGDPTSMLTTSNAEIHRFYRRSNHKFSSDYFSTIPSSESVRTFINENIYVNNPSVGNSSSEGAVESFLHDWNDAQVLRHQQIHRLENFFHSPGNPPGPELFKSVVDWSMTITNENDPTGSSDVKSCQTLAGPDETSICQHIESDFGYNTALRPFPQPVSELTTISNSPYGYDENRYTVFAYDAPVLPDDPDGDPAYWDLGKPVFTGTCEVPDPNNPQCSDWTEEVSTEWERVYSLGSSDDWFPSEFRRQKGQRVGPGGTGITCTDQSEGCVETVYTYDDLVEFPVGNLIRVDRSGGYGVDGFAQSVPAEVTEYAHGNPIRHWLDDDGQSLLLWERSIDPGTGLTRWQVDGAGVGRAYSYDVLGRVTDVVPIEGTYSGSLPDGTWSLILQPYAFDDYGDPTAFLKGSHFDYFLPGSTDSDLAWRSVSDASYAISTDGTVTPGVVGTERAKLSLDGMGRPTKLTEFYLGDPAGTDPDRTNSRSRFRLDYFFDSADENSLNPCGDGLPDSEADGARVTMSSEWFDGSTWPGCSSLNWTTTQYDSLMRPIAQELPDGAMLTTEYIGDGTVKTTRNVVTSSDGNVTKFDTIAHSDGLGRLRLLKEEVSSGQFIDSEYGYWANDRLRTVVISDGAEIQHRSYEYSDGGFLSSSTEPEQFTRYLSYDALGNLLFENTKLKSESADSDSISTVYVYDEFSRLTTKAAGPPSGTKVMGVFKYDSSEVGNSNYGKLYRASQNNWYSDSEPYLWTTIEHTWSYGSPGGRIVDRTTRLKDGGIGGSEDGFLIKYGYDQWGNRNYTKHPSWTPWGDDCSTDPVVEQVYTFDGSWLESAALIRDFETTPFASVDLKYHPNGRTDEAKMYAGAVNVATQTEVIDGDGMARPKSISFSEGGTTRWEQTNYSYDGSGNIASFNLAGDTAQVEPRAFTYDGLNRLKEFHVNSTEVEDYSYDAFGNMEDFDGFTMPTDHETNRIENLGDTEIPDSDWDNRGNLLRLPAIPALNDQRQKFFTFSAEDRLMESIDTDSSGPKWRYAYDISGGRVVSWRKNGDGITPKARITLRDEGGAVLSDWAWSLGIEGDPTTFSRQRGYLYAGGRMIAQVDWSGTPVRRFAAVDHLGSTRYLLSEDSGAWSGELLEFSPFGGFLEGGPTSDTTHLFTGHERDFGYDLSQLDYMHARYYSSNLGRFMSVDPVGGSVGSSQSWNRYSYVKNNPILLVDPSGQFDIVSTFRHQNISRMATVQANYVRLDDVVNGNKMCDAQNIAGMPKNESAHLNTGLQRQPTGSAGDTRVVAGQDRLAAAIKAFAGGDLKSSGENLGFAHHSFQDVLGHGGVSHAQHYSKDNAFSMDRTASLGFLERFLAAGELTGEINQIFNDAIEAFGDGADLVMVIFVARGEAATAVENSYNTTRSHLVGDDNLPEGF